MSYQNYGPLLDALAGVSWPARRPIGAGVAGAHPSRLRGMTAEFTEYRPYRQGDDFRRLDWKLLARTDRAYLRITDDHATRTTLLLLDASASLGFPADTNTKWIQACRVAVGLAAVARGDGDPVGLIIPRESGPVRIAPQSRRGVIAEIVRATGQVSPDGSAAMVPWLTGARPGWRVAIISDFLSEESGLLARARQLIVEGVEVFAAHIVSGQELDPPSAARLATDPEDSSVRRVLHQGSREAYAEAFGSWRAELRESWRRTGAEYTEVRAEEDSAAAIRRIVRGAAEAAHGA